LKGAQQEVIKKDKNGVEKSYDIIAAPILEQGKVVSIIESYRDISEYKKMQADLSKMNSELKENDQKLTAKLMTIKGKVASNEHRYRNALFHLMSSQTSCYRYWGQGLWTDYGQEICRRTSDILNYDF